MFKRLFARRGNELQKGPDALHMPNVDVLPDIEEVFDSAREAATRERWQAADQSRRYVVIVTPQRQFLFCPCPPQGAFSRQVVDNAERMISSKVKKNIAVISFNEINDPTDPASINSVIPFYGMLLSIAYIGHAVWVFEGHRSALAAGCRDADALIVDSGMKPFLQEDWLDVASGVMRGFYVYVHDRASYSLRLIT